MAAESIHAGACSRLVAEEAVLAGRRRVAVRARNRRHPAKASHSVCVQQLRHVGANVRGVWCRRVGSQWLDTNRYPIDQ